MSNSLDAPLPKALDSATRAVFGTMTRLRGKRAMHPRGLTFVADLHVDAAPAVTSGIFQPRAHHPALLRLSKSIGLPPRLPDILGFSVKVPDAYGPGRDQNLALATSASPPLLRHLLVPAVGIEAAPYTTLLLYRVGDRRLLFCARAQLDADAPRPLTLDQVEAVVADGGLTFSLLAAEPGGRWERVATVTPRRLHRDPVGTRLSFNPWDTSPDLLPVGLLQRLRRPAYEASAAARGHVDENAAYDLQSRERDRSTA